MNALQPGLNVIKLTKKSDIQNVPAYAADDQVWDLISPGIVDKAKAGETEINTRVWCQEGWDLNPSNGKFGYLLREAVGYDAEIREMDGVYYAMGHAIAAIWVPEYLSPKGGRPVGYSPIRGEGGAMVQTQIKTSLPQEDLDWLNSQSNKSETVRKAIALYRQSFEELRAAMLDAGAID